MNEIVVERLGTAGPGEHGKDSKRDTIDGHPIVLWRGDTPAAVFYYRLRVDSPGSVGEQRIERLDQPSHRPFPLVFGSAWNLPIGAPDIAELFDMQHWVTADVNGDGVDELILPRKNGEIEVYSLDRKLYSSSPIHAPKGKAYAVERTFVAKLPGHDVVLLLLSLDDKFGHKATDNEDDEKPSDLPDYAILRIDRQGVSQVPLPVKTAQVTALGGINRPGSPELDEVLILYQPTISSETISFARLGKGNALIEAPKEVYVHIPEGLLQFVSLAQTTSAIAVDQTAKRAYFIQPDKASNWISDIDLGPMDTTDRGVHTLEAVDQGPDPKLLVQTNVDVKEGEAPKGQALFAVNRQGTCFGPAPSGQGWRPLPKVQPFLTLSNPSDDHIFVGLLHQIGTESLLSVYTKEAKPKKLTEKEVFEAADRFLAPEYVAQVRSMYALEIDHLKSVPNCSEKERARRHVDVEIRTVDEWRRLLPDSYHEALAFKMMGVKVDLEVELTSSLQQPIDPDEYRNLNEYSAWLETIRGKSETVFDVISQGRMARRFAIPGNFPERLRTSSYERRLDWRAGANSAAIVLPLDPTPTVSVAKHPWGFFRITIPTWRQ